MAKPSPNRCFPAPWTWKWITTSQLCILTGWEGQRQTWFSAQPTPTISSGPRPRVRKQDCAGQLHSSHGYMTSALISHNSECNYIYIPVVHGVVTYPHFIHVHVHLHGIVHVHCTQWYQNLGTNHISANSGHQVHFSCLGIYTYEAIKSHWNELQYMYM